jgi:serine/threonine protein kinase
MPIAAGTSLGLYEIIAGLGAGGMGEVYRARDTKLGRTVAIKVLPEALAFDTDRVARLTREARMLASLNHPRVAALHGMEQSEGRHFLVMELVEGETLADKLARGPLPVQEALNVARQIAEALEAAHEKGVIQARRSRARERERLGVPAFAGRGVRATATARSRRGAHG